MGLTSHWRSLLLLSMAAAMITYVLKTTKSIRKISSSTTRPWVPRGNAFRQRRHLSSFQNPFGRIPTRTESSKEDMSDPVEGVDVVSKELKKPKPVSTDMNLLEFLAIDTPPQSEMVTGKNAGLGMLENEVFPRTNPKDRKGVVIHDPPTPSVSSAFPLDSKSKKTFESVGVTPPVASALANAGFERPTIVQSKAIPEVNDQKNRKKDHVIIAGPTGSGKTLAYLAPILSRLLETTSAKGIKHRALILCPNVALAKQVYDIVDAVLSNSAQEHPIRKLSATLIDSELTKTPVGELGNIVVSSTAQFLKFSEYGSGSKSQHKALMKSVDFVVLDEADLQLSGSYQTEVRHLISYLRHGYPGHPSREYYRSDFTKFLLVNFLKLKNKPQFVFAAATLPENSPKSPGTVLHRAVPYARWVHADFFHQTVPSVDFGWVQIDKAKTEVENNANLEEKMDSTSLSGESLEESGDFDEEMDQLLDDFEEDQNIHDTLNLDDAKRRIPFLAEALRDGPNRALIFCNRIASADCIADGLNEIEGIQAQPWHREIEAESRQNLLDAMRVEDKEDTKNILCLVCTDAAARGIDLPRVGHVLQAEFARNAVDFLHRVGRTGRLGRDGKVTSLIDEKSRDLALQLRTSIETGVPVEATFSRKRSFRKNINRRAQRQSKMSNPQHSNSFGDRPSGRGSGGNGARGGFRERR